MDFKRQPFVEKKISEIDSERDTNVCILGNVIDIKKDMIVIDDGTDKTAVFFTDENALKNLKINNTVRMFGTVLPTLDGFEIRGEIIQDMSNLDIDLYKSLTD